MTTVVSNTIQKSLRLPVDIVNYIELQPGDSFSNKLVNLLYDIMNGDEMRQGTIEKYDEMIQERRIRLVELNKKVNGASMLVSRLQVFCSTAEAAGLLEEPENTTSSIEEREPIPFA